MTQYALTMLLAGIGIPLLAGLNAALGKYIGSPATAAVILFIVALSISLVVMVATGTEGFKPIAVRPQTSVFSRRFRCVLCADHNLHRPTFWGRKRCLFRLAGTID